MALRLRRAQRFLRTLINPRLGLAILLSGIFWIGVTLDRNPTSEAVIPGNIPVDPIGISDGLVLVGALEPIQVAVRGPRTSLDMLTTRSFVARVDLTSVSAGFHLVPVEVDNADPRIEIDRVTPDLVSVQLDRSIKLAVPVRLDLRGVPAGGYRSENISYSPTTIDILGAETAVRQVAAIQAKIDLTGRSSPMSIQISGVPVNDAGDEILGIQATSRLIDVEVPITAITIRKTVPVRAQVVGIPSPGKIANRYTVIPGNIEIEGPPQAIETIDQILIEPVDIGGASDDVTSDVSLIIPDGIILTRADNQVRVIVNLTSIEGTASFVVAVVVTDVETGLLPSVTPNSVQAVIVGSPEQFEMLTTASITAQVSMTGRRAGTHEIRPIILSPTDTQVQSVEPETVVVTLTEISATDITNKGEDRSGFTLESPAQISSDDADTPPITKRQPLFGLAARPTPQISDN
jgi:YbbR domain-containing protein